VAVRRKSREIEVIKRIPPVSDYLSTGCTLLDLAISDTYPGGFGAGRINHLWGTESSSKSVLVAEILGAAQRKGGKATLIETEGTFDESRAEDLFGVDTRKLKYISPEKGNIKTELSIEYLFDELLTKMEDEAAKTKAPCVGAVDSLSAIPSMPEIERGMGEATYGTDRAQALSRGFRKHVWRMNRSGLGMVFVDQSRDKIAGFGGKTFSGGNALRFFASTRVMTQVVKTLINKHKKPIGIRVKAKIEKNKIAPPYREIEFIIRFDYGIDDIATNLDWLKQNDPTVPKKGNVYVIPGVKKKGTGLASATKIVEAEQAEEALIERLVKVWHMVYSDDDERIPRRRFI